MTIQIDGFKIENKRVHIYATDISMKHEIMLRQERVDELRIAVEFAFTPDDYRYLRNWLCQMKRIQEEQPKTWGEALSCIIGTYTQSPSSYYRVYDDFLEHIGESV